MFNTNPGSRFAGLVYDASVRLRLATCVIAAGTLMAAGAWARGGAQEDASLNKSAAPADNQHEPKYDQTFSGPVIELTATKITVSRSILGKQEKRSFLLQSDTRIEGKLRMHVKVTVGYISTDDGDVARLVVVRPKSTPKSP
jgi:hypothetical protein